MTYQYSEINQHDALYKAARAYPGGVEALAQRLGMSSNVLYKKLRPTVDTHFMNYEEVSEIVEMLDSAGCADRVDMVLGALCWRHNRVVFKLPDVEISENDLFANVLMLFRDEGRLFGNLKDLMNGSVTAKTASVQAIEKDLQVCITSMVVLRNAILTKFAKRAG